MENNQEIAKNSNSKKAGRESRRISDSFIIVFLLSYLFMSVGQLVGLFTYVIPVLWASDVSNMVVIYLDFIGVWIVALLYMRFTEKNRPILQVLWKKPSGNRPKYLLFGIVLGFALNGACILIACLHGDIMLCYDAFNPVYLVLLFIVIFIQSAAEEMVCRGFAYQRLLKSYGKPWIAIWGNSVMFGLFHVFNPGATVLSVWTIVMFGVLFSAVMYYTDSLWCAMGLHAAWNFTQNILFGLPNSGIVSSYSLFQLDAATARDSFAYNVGFGIEGTLMANVVLTAACICVCLWGRKYGRKPFWVWGEE